MEANNLINTKPILYLGRDRVNGAFYFLGDKSGVGRFIKFLAYPLWCTGDMLGNFLDIGAEVPTEILAEVMLFINGVVNYELLPAKRGRAETIVRTELETGISTRSPTKSKKLAGEETSGSPVESASSSSSGKAREGGRGINGSEKSPDWPFPNFGFNDTRRGNVGSAPVDESSEKRGGNKQGRPSSNARVLDADRNVEVKSEANTVQACRGDNIKTLASTKGEEPVKKRRGRPPKIKTLD